MDERKENRQQEEYQVIQEQIVSKKKKLSWKRIGKGVFRTTLYGMLFGISAAVSLAFAGRFLIDKLGLEDVLRQLVAIGDATPTPRPTPTQTVTEPDKTVTKPPTQSPKPTAVTETVTPEVTVSIEGNGEQGLIENQEHQESLQDFLNIYAGVSQLAKKLENSLVHITATVKGVDWFEEDYETKKNAVGLYVADNGVDMLFLVNLDSIEGATRFEIKLIDGTVLPATIFSYDTNYRLAVLSVRLSAANGVLQEALPEKARFVLEDVQAGVPVMVLGYPNGHAGAMELGMTTGVNQVVPVIDDEVMYFTMGITRYADGDGFVFNLSGEVIGIVSSQLNNGETGVFTAAMVSGMRETIDKLLNKQPRIYCGMRLETVDEEAKREDPLSDGIYVTEVLPASPAMIGGIKNGDIILSVEDIPITGVRQFYEVVSEMGTSSGIRITVSRELKKERKKLSLYITPEERMH